MKFIIGYVEDPGVANFFISNISVKDYNFILYASEPAYSYLKNKNVVVKKLNEDFNENDILSVHCKILLVGTGENKNTPAFKLVKYAKSLKIKTVSIIDAPTSLASRYKGHSKNIFENKTDFILASHYEIKKELISLGLSNKQIFLCRHPYYDIIEEKKIELSQLSYINKINNLKISSSNQKVIIFLCEVSTGLNADEFLKSKKYSLKGKKTSIFRTHVVIDELIDVLSSYEKNVLLILRLHPKDKINEYLKYEKYVSFFSQKEDAHDLIFSADLIIGMTTNLLVEAAIMNKKVLSIVPRKEELHWIADAVKPNIPCVFNKKNIAESIKDLLENNDKTNYKRNDINYLSISSILKILISEAY